MTIVAAVDRSEHAERIADEANTLANAFDEPLHLVHVLSRSEFVEMEETSVNETGDALEVDQIREIAASIAEESVADTDISAETVGLVGEAADEVVRYADEVNARYIVVGGRKRSPVGKAIFGSVTQSILLNSQQPVLSFRSD